MNPMVREIVNEMKAEKFKVVESFKTFGTPGFSHKIKTNIGHEMRIKYLRTGCVIDFFDGRHKKTIDSKTGAFQPNVKLTYDKFEDLWYYKAPGESFPLDKHDVHHQIYTEMPFFESQLESLKIKFNLV